MSVNGKIVSCAEMAPICGYRCCDQDPPANDAPVSHTDYILMYPGEYDAGDPRQQHLDPVGEYAGGILARCRSECFDQSSCDPTVNYKPLDCRSYPLTPALMNSELTLIQDTRRCPLKPEDIDIPPEHSEDVLRQWREAINRNSGILDWLARLSLEGTYHGPYTSLR